MSEIQSNIERFERDNTPEALIEAADVLDSRFSQMDPVDRQRARGEGLSSRLALLKAIDKHIDPQFDPNDLPQLNLSASEDLAQVFRSGIDPQAVTDPEVRRRYEEALEQNRLKADRYRFQKRLRDIDRLLTPRVAAFISANYSGSAADVAELNEILEHNVSRERIEKLKQLISP